MKKIDKNQLVLIVFCCLIFGNSALADDRYVLGGHYELIETNSQKNSTASHNHKIQVEKIFWYGCKHCFRFEKIFKQWQGSLKSDVSVISTPAPLTKRYKSHAKFHYILQHLSLADKLSFNVFNTIHNTNDKLITVESQKRYLLSNTSLTKSDIDAAYESLEVSTRLEETVLHVKSLGVKNIPVIIINNKYLTSPRLAGGYESALKITEYLINKEKQLKR